MTATACTSYLTVFAFLAIGSNLRKSTSPIPVALPLGRLNYAFHLLKNKTEKCEIKFFG